jgi:predicted transcriptional regulator
MTQIQREKTEVVSFSLPVSLKKHLLKFAEQEDVPVSQIAKKALKSYLALEQLENVNKGFRKAALKLGITSDEDVERIFG